MNPETVNLENSVGPSFALLQDGSMFVPYGEFRHREGMQQFDRASAERMGEDLRGILSQIRRVVRDGIARRAPIYIGHPDVPGRGAEFPDKRAYGWVTAVTAENDGMRLTVKWTSEGDRLVREGHFAYYSPYWEADEVGAGRARVLRPARLISVGLTNNPNIPVPALANEAADESNPDDESDDMKKELAELLGKDDTASAEDLLAEVKRLRDAAAEEADDAQENDDDEADDDDADDDADDADERAAAENDRLISSIRAERIGMALDSLCLAGRLAVADRPAASQRLAACANDADFAAALNEMSTASPALKTKGATDGLAETGGAVKAENDLAAIKQKRTEMIDAELRRNGGNFSAAWAKCARAKPELFT